MQDKFNSYCNYHMTHTKKNSNDFIDIMSFQKRRKNHLLLGRKNTEA